MRTSAEGQALIGIVIISSLLFMLASAAALTSSLSNRSRVKTYSSDRGRAYYATEGAVVRAMQKLWTDPTYCGETFAASADTNNLPVLVTVTNCGAGNDHQISAQVANY